MRASALFVTIVPPIVFAILFIALAQPPWPAYRLVGLTLAVIGFTGLTIARFTLGDSFSIAPEVRTLVTRGIYSGASSSVRIWNDCYRGSFSLHASSVGMPRPVPFHHRPN
jgi:protein-S-isoprenylcysteine O-methyltransferase Ste14